MKKFLFTIIILTQAVCFSQSVGGALGVVATTGEFNTYVKNAAGFTADFSFYTPPNSTSMTFGFDVGYFIYDYTSQTSTFYSGNGFSFDAKEERTSSIVTFHGFLRAIGPEKSFRPYADMIFGGALFTTSSSVKNYVTNEELSSNWDHSSWAWNAGVGGGLMISVYKPDVKSFIGTIYLDLRARYLVGSRTSYLRKEDIKVDQYGTVYFFPSKSKTDMMLFSVGVEVPFSTAAGDGE